MELKRKKKLIELLTIRASFVTFFSWVKGELAVWLQWRPGVSELPSDNNKNTKKEQNERQKGTGK